MKDTKKKDKQNMESPMKGYNPTGRDFQYTEKDIDTVNKSEKEEIEKNKRTEKGNTTPNKKRMD
jgi:hypothetical protein